MGSLYLGSGSLSLVAQNVQDIFMLKLWTYEITAQLFYHVLHFVIQLLQGQTNFKSGFLVASHIENTLLRNNSVKWIT
jgi:hypothetical protein